MSRDTDRTTQPYPGCEVRAVLSEACTDRSNGYQGRNARDVLRDMEKTIVEIED